MFPEEDFNILSSLVYQVDIKKVEKPWQKGDILEHKNLSQPYIVLKIEDNTINGMQAMAVAPFKNNKVDTSEIVIAYAGTNIDDKLDINTDIQTVILGNKDALLKRERIGYTTAFVHVPYESQITSAEKFAENIKTSNIST